MTPNSKTFALIAAALLPVLQLTAQTVSSNAATLWAANVRGFPGRTVGVPVSLTHTGGVSGVQLDLSYVANKLLAGAYQAGGLSNNVVLRSRQLGPGHHRVLAYTKDLTALKTNQPLGSMPFTVPAGDFNGGGPVALTNAVVSRTNATAASPIQIVSGAVVIAPVFIGEDGVVDLFLRVLANRTYIVQATTNFVNWVNVATNFAASDFLFATDSTAFGLPMRFYRAVSLPETVPWKLTFVSRQAGQVTLRFSGPVGQSFVVQVSSDLVHWTNYANGTLSVDEMLWVDAATSGVPIRFYRLGPYTALSARIGAAQLQAGGKFAFDYPSTPGRMYVVQVSTNLSTWSGAATNLAATNILSYTNFITPGKPREFFRVVELP